MSVKKSKDTVGGQDVSGVIKRLESVAKEEKNLTRPYLCVVCIATPYKGKLLSGSDRQIKCNKAGSAYSLNCENWGPGFIFPYVTGHNARDIYLQGVKRVADHLPFYSLKYRKECSALLAKQLGKLGLLNKEGKISQENRFLLFGGLQMSSHLPNALFDAHPICVIITEDSRKVLPSLKDSVDLIVTSPPYADSRKKHYDSIHPDHFVEWFRTFHDSLWNALKPTGSLVINIKDKVVNSVRHRYVWHTIEMLSTLGWFCIDDYIWHKTNPMPGYWPTRLRDGWEYCFHLAKSPKPYINQNAVRRPIGNWVKARLSNMSENDLTRQNSVNKSGFGRNISRWADKKTVLPSNVISLPLVGVNKGHPAVFPPELPEFFIKMLSPRNGLIVDPFAGSGMTGLAAMNLSRDCVLIDNNEEYAKLAFRNLQDACVDDKFEIELRLADEQNVRFPKQKVSPLLNLQRRHGLIKHVVTRYDHHFQPAAS